MVTNLPQQRDGLEHGHVPAHGARHVPRVQTAAVPAQTSGQLFRFIYSLAQMLERFLFGDVHVPLLGRQVTEQHLLSLAGEL